MIEFDEVTYFQSAARSWAARGASGIYSIVETPAKNVYVFFRLYTENAPGLFEPIYETYEAAEKAAQLNEAVLYDDGTEFYR